ncbi:MAG: hypothetical protein GY913_27700 [Proteobacteria bacterium]|nr:hypothetical protein [Pseudomonadota bacterium]MCP4920701.1 hypothetical protein [Pseudomonadota bacterium]
MRLWKAAQAHNRSPRESALQICCFDPILDHTGAPQRGFPCLQQISMTRRDGGFALHALYPTQHVFSRGYGNYLGLQHLGAFLEAQIGIPFRALEVVVLSAELGGKVTKAQLRPLTNYRADHDS